MKYITPGPVRISVFNCIYIDLIDALLCWFYNTKLQTKNEVERIIIYKLNNKQMKQLIIPITFILTVITLITYNIVTTGIINYISFNGI